MLCVCGCRASECVTDFSSELLRIKWGNKFAHKPKSHKEFEFPNEVIASCMPMYKLWFGEEKEKQHYVGECEGKRV